MLFSNGKKDSMDILWFNFLETQKKNTVSDGKRWTWLNILEAVHHCYWQDLWKEKNQLISYSVHSSMLRLHQFWFWPIDCLIACRLLQHWSQLFTDWLTLFQDKNITGPIGNICPALRIPSSVLSHWRVWWLNCAPWHKVLVFVQGKKKSETKLTASVLKKDPKHT